MKKTMSARIMMGLLGVTCTLAACGKSESSSDDAATTTTTTTTATGTLALVPSIVLASPTGSTSTTTLALADAAEDKLDVEDPKVAVAALDQAFANAKDIKGCLVGLGRIARPDRNTNCYGPSVLYRNHPDATSGDPSPAHLPSGDLGVFDASEANGEACVAAKMNEMTGKIRKTVQESIETGKRALCFATVLGKDLPTEEGETLDLTADVKTALDAIATDLGKKGKLSFSAIKITLVEVAETGNVFQTDVQAEVPRGSLWTRVVTKKYSDTHTKGYVWGVFTKSATATNLQGPAQRNDPEVFSVIYDKEGDVIKFEGTKSAAESNADKTALETDKASLFESDKRVRVATTGTPGYAHVMANINSASGAGEMVFMWTAGGAQEEQRTLHAKVTASGDTRSGWGYFGFGPKLGDFRTAVKAGTVSATQQSIERMICNWAGPNNNHTGINYAQKQLISFSTDKFTATANYVGFAARNNCGQGVTGGSFEVAKGNPNDTVTYAAWPAFSLQDISTGEDKTNLQSVKSLLLDTSL
ncbi:MAG TPA: hypothetical protein VFO10_11950 [Oligoflexus sp.]|uniref:hypothetical protein n=1 Tax=Oligoflexus sp. TaxID=1971216 RepID=UPI002D80E5F9|nr:hypothetical protein [Oligoflexus sp.]HET9237961.1 hypothetical protein [Oligoflexus sp.]